MIEVAKNEQSQPTITCGSPFEGVKFVIAPQEKKPDEEAKRALRLCMNVICN